MTHTISNNNLLVLYLEKEASDVGLNLLRASFPDKSNHTSHHKTLTSSFQQPDPTNVPLLNNSLLSSSVDPSFNSGSIASTQSIGTTLQPSIITEPSVTMSGNEQTSSSTISSSSIQSAAAAIKNGQSNSGAIAGGIIGGFVFIGLLSFVTVLLLRRRRRKRTPPSAEFLARMERTGSPLGISSRFVDSRQVPFESPEDLPPAFTPGNFNDPLLEKLHESRMQTMSRVV